MLKIALQEAFNAGGINTVGELPKALGLSEDDSAWTARSTSVLNRKLSFCRKSASAPRPNATTDWFGKFSRSPNNS